jgi:hypothetical protein
VAILKGKTKGEKLTPSLQTARKKQDHGEGDQSLWG